MNTYQKLLNFLPLFLVGIVVYVTFSFMSKSVKSKIKFYEDSYLMEEEILAHISVGSSIFEAKKIMEENHFKCEYLQDETFGTPEKKDFLHCDFSRPLLSKGLLTSRRWLVAIDHQEEKVESVSVSTGLIGL